MRAARTTLIAGALAVAASCAAPRSDAPIGKSRQAADWSGGAIDPIRIRQLHTSTLLGTGEVFVAGGTSSPATTELVDPYRATVMKGPDLVTPRSSHTATMLLSGKVLLAGGKTDTAELYDPVTRTTVATGSMAKVRANHVAVRMRDGKVLVTGGVTIVGTTPDLSSEIYDPAAGTWSAGPTRIGENGVNAIATLDDGRIVIVSQNTTEVFDGTAWTRVIQGFPFSSFNEQTLTRLPGGRLVNGWVQGCATLDGVHFSCANYTSILSADATTTVDGPEFGFDGAAYTAVRTIEGQVLFVGGSNGASGQAELLTDFAASKLTPDGNLTAEQIGPTATVLPGGDILVVGGAQAKIQRRPSPGAWRDSSVLLLFNRERHVSTRLHDGTVLVAGGENRIESFPSSQLPVLDAEIVDVGANTTTAVTGKLPSSHIDGAMVTLRDGRALLTGGGTADTAIYAPGAGFAAGPPMSVARTGHTSTLLPSGRVLVVGGTADLSASEVFDPATNTWTTGPTAVNAYARHGAVLMPNGLVLVIGGTSAEIFDETKNAFRATTLQGGSREGITAHLLPNGKVFVAGGATLAAEVFDPVSETWSYTGSESAQALDQYWVGIPSGKLVASGGRPTGIDSSLRANELFDPLAHPTGTFFRTDTNARTTYRHSAALAGTGEVLQTGGNNCNGACVSDSMNEMSIYGDAALATLKPAITSVAETVTAGTKVQIEGTGFANGAEASDGTHASSPVNHPTAVWISDAGDAVVPSTILDFTDTTATWLVPTTALYGHGLLFVNVAGVMSKGRSVTILPALAPTACANDAQCKTGFCTDGVCCDRRCDGTCEACTAALKTSGEDGVCGAVPPGVGTCILKLGEACKGSNECGTGFCAQGVCCDSTCDGQCLACNLQGKIGRCSAINEGACGAACDGDHTLKAIGQEDTDCTPYKCGGATCNQTCASARDCVAPAVCGFDGHCVPPAAPPAGNDTVCGCRAAGAPAPPSSALALLALGVAFAWRRHRRA